MNSPAETAPQDETRSAFCARCGYAWYVHGSFDFDDLCDAFVAKEPRSAVVRPTPEMVGTQDAPVVSAAEASAALDSIAPRRSDSQPVRPTRSEIEELIATHIRAYACRERDAERLAVALLASFGVAVSDSQETPR